MQFLLSLSEIELIFIHQIPARIFNISIYSSEQQDPRFLPEIGDLSKRNFHKSICSLDYQPKAGIGEKFV